MQKPKVTIKLTRSFSGEPLANVEISRVPMTEELIFVRAAEVYRVKRVIHTPGTPIDAIVEVSDSPL
jgi:hypothetical protein